MVALALTLLAAVDVDSSVVNGLRRAAPGLRSYEVVHRRPLSSADLVLAVAHQGPGSAIWRDRFAWDEASRLAVMLQDRNDPERLKLLDLRPGSRECSAVVDHASETALVVRCLDSKGWSRSRYQWAIDPAARRMRGFWEYPTIVPAAAATEGDELAAVGTDGRRLAVIAWRAGEDAPRLLSAAEARPWLSRVRITRGSGSPEKAWIFVQGVVRPPPAGMPALPRTTYRQFADARPQRVKDGYSRPEDAEMNERVGPWVRRGDRVWFGLTFYDGEGQTGVGGFGYFVPGEKRLHLLRPREILDWSVSALAVTEERVWMGLAYNGEYGPYPGGVLRYDPATEESRHFALADVPIGLLPAGERVGVATQLGFAVLEGGRVRRYFIGVAGAGRPALLEAN